eukprot:1152863-Pelagomonas_calceolata.AAC.1
MQVHSDVGDSTPPPSLSVLCHQHRSACASGTPHSPHRSSAQCHQLRPAYRRIDLFSAPFHCHRPAYYMQASKQCQETSAGCMHCCAHVIYPITDMRAHPPTPRRRPYPTTHTRTLSNKSQRITFQTHTLAWMYMHSCMCAPQQRRQARAAQNSARRAQV